jgi:hypothetical protein
MNTPKVLLEDRLHGMSTFRFRRMSAHGARFPQLGSLPTGGVP